MKSSWSPGAQSPVKFDVFASWDNGSSWHKLTTSGKISGTSYQWAVPLFPKNKAKCRIKVVGFNAAGTTRLGSDLSDGPFTIGVLDVLSPNGGEGIASGMLTTVTWNTLTRAPVAGVVLSYTLDGGATWKRIAEAADTGSYAWMAPQVARDAKAKLRVDLKNSSGGTAGTDQSDGAFNIQAQSAETVDLEGDWYMGSVAVGGPGTANNIDTILMDLSIDGDGSLHYTILQHSAGLSGADTVPVHVAADGQLTAEAMGKTLHGVVAAGAKAFVMADTVKSDNDLFSFMAIQKSFSMSPDDVAGTFIAAQYGKETGDNHGWFELSEVTFDGAGSATHHCLWSSGGGCGSDDVIPVTVSPDGSFTVGYPGWYGVMSPDGRMFQIVDTDKTDGEISFVVGMRKPGTVLTPDRFAGKFYMTILGEDDLGVFDSLARVKPNGAGDAAYAELYASDGKLHTANATYDFDPATGLLSLGGLLQGVVTEDGQAFVLVQTDGSSGESLIAIGLKARR